MAQPVLVVFLLTSSAFLGWYLKSHNKTREFLYPSRATVIVFILLYGVSRVLIGIESGAMDIIDQVLNLPLNIYRDILTSSNDILSLVDLARDIIFLSIHVIYLYLISAAISFTVKKGFTRLKS